VQETPRFEVHLHPSATPLAGPPVVVPEVEPEDELLVLEDAGQ